MAAPESRTRESAEGTRVVLGRALVSRGRSTVALPKKATLGPLLHHAGRRGGGGARL